MDRREFGRLVASLRQDLEWTQFNLHEYAQIDLAVVSQIERGVKRHFEPELLVKLADAFQLTTWERREFFFAAAGVATGGIVRPQSAALASETLDANQALAKMLGLLERLQVPAFLLDVYSDVVAANYMAFSFFQVPMTIVQNAASTPGGFNIIRLVFGKELTARTHIVTNWEQAAMNTMRFFREASLRYRMKPYFQYLIKTFRNPAEYPLFDRFWKMVSSTEQDHAANFDLFSFDHDTFGHLAYSSATTICLTAYGELLLIQYLPVDEVTKAVFDRLLAQSGTGVIRYGPWPHKPLP